MTMTMTLAIDGHQVTFRRTLGSWVYDFGKNNERSYVVHFQMPDRNGGKWRAWRPLGQEALTVGDTLTEVWTVAQRHWINTLRDGDVVCRRKKYQPVAFKNCDCHGPAEHVDFCI
jgi:hypothetical protein